MLSFLFIFLCHVFLNQAAILHCDFESDCNDFVFDDNWGLTDGQHSQGITHDHTLNTSAGHYHYYDPQDTSRFSLAEIKTSAWLEPSMNHTLCFHMWYYTPRANSPFNIQVGQGDDEQLALVLVSIKGKDPSTNDWALINVTLPNEKLKIFIRMNTTAKPLVFDDFSVDYCDEPHPTPPKILYSCDFESSCSADFVSLPVYPYQSSVLNASDAVKIESQAPAIDYTFGNASGHYALLPNSNDAFKLGNVGYMHLQMPIQITSNQSYCFNFQYYSFGSLYAKSYLQIYSWTYEEPKTVQLLWPIRYSDEYSYTIDQWTWGIVNLPVGNYTLLFRVDSSDTYLHMFALDNIIISSCNYPPYPLSPYSSLLSFLCNFDNSTMCDMINTEPSSSTEFNFTVFTGQTIPNKNLGPIRDHTTNSTTGGFLYWYRELPFTSRDYGRVYPMKTIQQNTGMCIKFSYYVNSTAVNKNGTTIVLSAGGCYGAYMWIRSLDDSQGWQTVIVPTEGRVCGETFYFDVSQTALVIVSVAFDDIEIDQCSFLIPTTTTTSTTTTTTFTTTVTTTEITTTSGTSTTVTTTTVTTTSLITSATTTSVMTTPNNAPRLLSFNGYSLITIYVLLIFVFNIS